MAGQYQGQGIQGGDDLLQGRHPVGAARQERSGDGQSTGVVGIVHRVNGKVIKVAVAMQPAQASFAHVESLRDPAFGDAV